MGVRFQEVVNKTYAAGDFYFIHGRMFKILEPIKTYCKIKCNFENIHYSCDGTKLEIEGVKGETYTICPFSYSSKSNLIGTSIQSTNIKW